MCTQVSHVEPDRFGPNSCSVPRARQFVTGKQKRRGVEGAVGRRAVILSRCHSETGSPSFAFPHGGYIHVGGDMCVGNPVLTGSMYTRLEGGRAGQGYRASPEYVRTHIRTLLVGTHEQLGQPKTETNWSG